MTIRKNEETGQHFISAPSVRSKRQRYEKMPLAEESRGFFAALSALFRRRRRPFAGSALADRIDSSLDFSDQISKAGKSALPGSLLFTRVDDQLREHASESYDRADKALDAIDADLDQEAAWLDQARPEEILNTLEARLDKKRVNLHTDLFPLADSLVQARIKLERFKHRHNLADDFHWGKRFDLAVIGQVGVLLLVEFIANSIFQSDTQQTGLIGGVLVALLTSLATIILGVMFGMGKQRGNQTLAAGGWQGAVLICLASLLAFIFVSSLSLIRIAGEAGDRNPLERARLQLMADPLAGLRAMLDLPAFAYTLCISFLIATVAWKYLEYCGAFPGGRKRAVEYLDALDKFEMQYADDLDEAKAIAEEQNEQLEEAPGFIAGCKVPVQALLADYQNVVEQHWHDGEDIKGAGRLFVAFIKENCEPVSDPFELPAAAVMGGIENYRKMLADRHAAFKRAAADLCAREDVSQDTIEMARERFNDKVEAKLAEFALERQAMLDKALDKYKADKSWRDEVLALSTAGKSAGRDAASAAIPGALA